MGFIHYHGKLTSVENGLPVDGDTIYEYNHEDCTESLFGAECTYHEGTQTYNSSDDTVTSTHSVNYDNYSFLYEETVDFFDRTVGKVTSFTNYQNETTSLSSEITYADTATVATKRATGIENKVDGQTISNFTYTYDDSGRITEVRAGGTLRYKYVYDESGQVALDYNFTDNTATKYVYDANGNILQKTPYTNVTTADLSTATQGTAINYTYDSNWGDKLVSYNGQSIVYDSIGNPTTYRGATLTWTGRMLTSFEKMSGDKLQRYEYSYNKDGLRTSKRYFEDGILQTETVYIWKNGILIGANVADENGNSLMSVKYIYNGEELVAINLNGYVLLVEKNLQGDITSLYDVVNEEKLFDFYYDAYGKMSVSQENSFIVTIIKALIVVCANVAYRGYYYDFDTGLYYLQSRYYDPQTGRFISLDDTQLAITTAGEPLGSNLYAYCYNSPVNTSDPTGEQPLLGNLIQRAVKSTTIFKVGRYITQKNYFSGVFKMAGFFMDEYGIYHTTFDCWQAYCGYCEVYDDFFGFFTDMKRVKLPFYYGGKSYIIWAWKGDYYNLGAGGEVGIYTGNPNGNTFFWKVDKSEALNMLLVVYYHKNLNSVEDVSGDDMIVSYWSPKKQWWITGFNPSYQNIKSKDLALYSYIVFNSYAQYREFEKAAKASRSEVSGNYYYYPEDNAVTLYF